MNIDTLSISLDNTDDYNNRFAHIDVCTLRSVTPAHSKFHAHRVFHEGLSWTHSSAAFTRTVSQPPANRAPSSISMLTSSMFCLRL